MHRILILADRPNWAFARRAEALQQYAPEDFVVDVRHYDLTPISELPLAAYDLVFCLPTQLAAPLRRQIKTTAPGVKLVVSHNSGAGRRESWLAEALVSADWTIVNNYGAWAAARERCVPRAFTCSHLSNGVDLDAFRPLTPPGLRPSRFLWTGSAGKVAGPEGDIKGYRRILQPLARALERLGHRCDFRVVEPGEAWGTAEMVAWYNRGAFLVCPSGSEGTPNILLEAMACGCVPIIGPVGNAAELVVDGATGVIPARSSLAAFGQACLRAIRHRRRIAAQLPAVIERWHWRRRARHFFHLFRRLIRGQAVAAGSYLRDELDD